MSAAIAGVEAAAAARVEIAGRECLLDPSGVLFLVEERVLVVADLHLEKGSSLARRGSLLPPYDTAATLAALSLAVARYRPREVVALGDSFHDRQGPDRLAERDGARLRALMEGLAWTWIVGNHDPELPPCLGGSVAGDAMIGPLVMRHHPAIGAARELAGHLHPVAKVVLHGRSVRARAFLTDGQRCILPAFGAYAGGLNACDPVFGPLFPRGFTAHVIGRHRIFSIERSVLCAD